MGSYVSGKDKNTILEEIRTTAEPNSVVHEQQKSAIIVRCTEDLEKVIKKLTEAINTSSKQSSKLQLWLIFWTSIMAIAIILQVIILYKQYLG